MLYGRGGSLHTFHSLHSRPEVQSAVTRQAAPLVGSGAPTRTNKHEVKPSCSEPRAAARIAFTEPVLARRSRKYTPGLVLILSSEALGSTKLPGKFAASSRTQPSTCSRKGKICGPKVWAIARCLAITWLRRVSI